MGVSLRQQTQSAINCEGPGGQSEGAGGQDTRGRERWGGRRWRKDSCVDGASWGTSPQRGQALLVMDDSGEEVFGGRSLPYKLLFQWSHPCMVRRRRPKQVDLQCQGPQQRRAWGWRVTQLLGQGGPGDGLIPIRSYCARKHLAGQRDAGVSRWKLGWHRGARPETPGLPGGALGSGPQAAWKAPHTSFHN